MGKINFNVSSAINDVNTPGDVIFFVEGITKRGPISSPSEVISSFSQFESIFGGEISTSDFPLLCKRALARGAKLRVNRVTAYSSGTPSASKSAFASSGAVKNGEGTPLTVFTIAMKNHGADYDNVRVIVEDATNGDSTYFNLKVNHLQEPDQNELYENLKIEGAFTVDKLHFLDDVKAKCKYVDFTYANLSSVTTLRPANATFTPTGGSNGTAPADADYVGDVAYKTGVYAFDAYDDAWGIAAPEIGTDTVNEALQTYANTRKDIPSFCHLDNSLTTVTTLKSARASLAADHELCFISAGGILVKDTYSRLTKKISEVGDILGLMAYSWNNSYPWFSPANQKRSFIPNCDGVVNNFGSKASSADLTSLGNAQINMVVFRNGGVYLSGNMTSQKANNPLKQFSVSMLILYIKRSLGMTLPIFADEPNVISTWESMYHTIEPFFKDLTSQEKRALWDWSWYGDQFAKNLDSLQINKKNDVLAGKYKVQLKVIPIAAMEEITINIIIDNNTNQISFA